MQPGRARPVPAESVVPPAQAAAAAGPVAVTPPLAVTVRDCMIRFFAKPVPRLGLPVVAEAKYWLQPAGA